MKKRESVVRVCIGIGLTIFILVLYGLKGFERLELQCYDLKFFLRGPKPHPDRVVLVTIDPESIKKLDTTLKDFSRSALAKTINQLSSSWVRLIGINMALSNRFGDSGADDLLRDAIARSDRVVLPRFISPQGETLPLKMFRDGEKGKGIIELPPDRDAVLRSLPAIRSFSSENDPTPHLNFSLEMARLLVDSKGEQGTDFSRPNQIKIGPLTTPTSGNKLYINYYGPPGTFTKIPIWRIVSGEFSTSELFQKVVLIGFQNAASHDAFRTPFSWGIQKEIYLEDIQTDLSYPDRMDGIEVQANALQMIIDEAFIYRISPKVVIVGIIFLGLISIAMNLSGESLLWVTGAHGLLLLFIPIAGTLLFFRDNIWIDIVPLMATVLINYLGRLSWRRGFFSHTG